MSQGIPGITVCSELVTMKRENKRHYLNSYPRAMQALSSGMLNPACWSKYPLLKLAMIGAYDLNYT